METPLRRLAPLLVLLGCRAAPLATARPPPAALDGQVDVGALSLHIRCVGQGSPAVVLDAGLGDDSTAWASIQPEVGRFARVCAYDRAGLGQSSPAPRPHGNRQMARELRALLARAGVPGPYVLVGHSMGGVNVRLFASEQPDEVAGMVLVDAVTAEQPARYWGLFSDEAKAQFRAGLLTIPEGLDLDTYTAGIADMGASSRSLGDRPLVVLTRGREDAPPGTAPELRSRMLGVWHELQAELPLLSTRSAQVIAQASGHRIHAEAPRLVVAAIHEVVEAARSGRRVRGDALLPLAQSADEANSRPSPGR